MAALVLLLAVVAAAQACAPPATTPSSSADKKPEAGGENKPKRRSPEMVVVTVVTNQKYDPSLNDEHLKTMEALLSDYVKSKNLVYDRSMVHERVTNVDGKFAVVYTVQNADCVQVDNFARGARRQAMFVTRIGLKCGDRPEFFIN
ncbi:hypothetical protein Y032_0098g3054 [Ancylostoma ceylanicum]|uniref:Uncharacterized protein n=1 Tax=Ancylostoma ceylanicum TaxID=53326 RepID=A0A016TJ16_9BILA|nr:hypothetical protein Y032_0098g3054 [Ancylostoma ceylanicum]